MSPLDSPLTNEMQKYFFSQILLQLKGDEVENQLKIPCTL